MQRNNNGTHAACAACKHQRKKCSINCVLAPYFPASRNREFQAVHKVFGVSNITKIVKNAKEDQRTKVVDSLVWEAFCRQKDPIEGAYGEYRKVYDEYKKLLHESKIEKDHNQILHLPSVNRLIEWNGSKGMHRGEGVENGLGFIHDHHKNNSIMDSNIYGLDFSQEIENLRPEVVLNHQFQHHHHQPYYVSGLKEKVVFVMAQLPPKIPNMTPNWSDFSNSHHHMVPSAASLSPNVAGTATTATTTTANSQHDQNQNQNPSWVDEFLDFSAARRGAHRRSVSDSIAFLEMPILDECGVNSGNMRPRLGAENEFDRFDDEQLMSMFGDEMSGAAMPPTFSSSNPSTPSDNSFNDEKEITNQHQQHQNLQKEKEDQQHQQQQQQQLMKNESEEVESQCKQETQAPNNTLTPSSSCDKITDPKRVKRILANRQSAQRSRVRKLQYISELERSVTSLQAEVSVLSPRVAFLDHQRLLLNVDNSALKQRIAALAQDKIFKDAHQEALKREIERLRQVYHQQNLKKMECGAGSASPSPNPQCNGLTEKEQLLNFVLHLEHILEELKPCVLHSTLLLDPQWPAICYPVTEFHSDDLQVYQSSLLQNLSISFQSSNALSFLLLLASDVPFPVPSHSEQDPQTQVHPCKGVHQLADIGIYIQQMLFVIPLRPFCSLPGGLTSYKVPSLADTPPSVSSDSLPSLPCANDQSCYPASALHSARFVDAWLTLHKTVLWLHTSL
ncbi:basic leucine zipper 61-like [Senna tora]|uniref:Basic leucine zipper 61-like n=1 Tax=Senna tora TaxID=362788 RepID=A0A835C926_9FABA|nr:basic leucine zipper 61-like [Senna tora]